MAMGAFCSPSALLPIFRHAAHTDFGYSGAVGLSLCLVALWIVYVVVGDVWDKLLG